MSIRPLAVGLTITALGGLAACGGEGPAEPSTGTAPASPPASGPPAKPAPQPTRTAPPVEPQRDRKDSEDSSGRESPPASQREFERYCDTHPDACAD